MARYVLDGQYGGASFGRASFGGRRIDTVPVEAAAGVDVAITAPPTDVTLAPTDTSAGGEDA